MSSGQRPVHGHYKRVMHGLPLTESIPGDQHPVRGVSLFRTRGSSAINGHCTARCLRFYKYPHLYCSAMGKSTFKKRFKLRFPSAGVVFK